MPKLPLAVQGLICRTMHNNKQHASVKMIRQIRAICLIIRQHTVKMFMQIL